MSHAWSIWCMHCAVHGRLGQLQHGHIMIKQRTLVQLTSHIQQAKDQYNLCGQSAAYAVIVAQYGPVLSRLA